MREIVFRGRLQRDLKRTKRRGKDLDDLLAVARVLAREGLLPVQYRPHKLSGEYAGLWECHIESDWLLVYDVTETEILLYRTGSHADLFE